MSDQRDDELPDVEIVPGVKVRPVPDRRRIPERRRAPRSGRREDDPKPKADDRDPGPQNGGRACPSLPGES